MSDPEAKESVDVTTEVRAALVAARRARGWSQRELAHRMKMSSPWLSSLESGASRDVRLSTLSRWATALDVHLELHVAGGLVLARLLP